MEEKKNFAEQDSEIILTPRNTNRVWIIEEPLIEMYMLLVHRIEGIGLSLYDFWKMDTWVLSKIYLTEIHLIDEENRKMKKGNNNAPEEVNDEATEELANRMFGGDDEE